MFLASVVCLESGRVCVCTEPLRSAAKHCDSDLDCTSVQRKSATEIYSEMQHTHTVPGAESMSHGPAQYHFPTLIREPIIKVLYRDVCVCACVLELDATWNIHSTLKKILLVI